ncbi:MAG: DUF5076 domain-containing protein [Phycisphaeraceae bacterium]|nr:DUF5076 domain-containing protein [Phycisphaeraceae bacterium]
MPDAAASDPRALEILRVWAAGGKQHVSIATDLWRDPANWGIMLVDLARHIANAYEQAGTMGRDEALSKIKAGLQAEWSSPTDLPTGRIKK